MRFFETKQLYVITPLMGLTTKFRFEIKIIGTLSAGDIQDDTFISSVA